MSNTITAYFKGRVGVAESVYQNDYGIVMAFDSIDLPAHFDCYFTVTGSNTAIPGVGADSRVVIPNTVLSTSGKVEVHIPLHTGENDSEVEYVAYFKVIGRARPVDDGTPAQMTAIEQAFALLQNPITNMEQIVNEALDFTGDTFDEMKADLEEWKGDTEEGLATWKGGVDGDIDVLEARMDSFTNLAEGSTTGDAELIDGRVGADSVTYNNIGTAIRTQVSDLKADIGGFYSHTIPHTGTNRYDISAVKHNTYLGSSGQYISYSGWDTSDFIYVGDCEAVICSGENNNTRQQCPMYFLCTYNDKREFISQRSGTNATYTVESGVAYIRFCTQPALYTDVMLESGTTRTTQFLQYKLVSITLEPSEYNDAVEVKDLITPLASSFSPIWEEVEVAFSNSNKFLTYAGEEASYQNCNYSEQVVCSGFEPQQIRFTGSAWSGIPAVLFFDANGNVLKTFPTSAPASATDYTQEILDIPQTTSYIVVNDLHSLGAFKLPIVETVSRYRMVDESARWLGKKWACVGDSLTEVNERATKRYHDYIKEVTGITVHNMGVGGTGYARGSESSNAFYQRISSIPLDADVITIFGSFNDLSAGLDVGTATDSGTSTLGGCINTTINNLLVAKPLANFGIITPTPWSWTNPANKSTDAYKYCEMIVQICKDRGIPCLDLFHNSLLRPWDDTFRTLAYSHDEGNGVHPDENGHKLIAPRIKGFLDTLLV